MGLFRKSHSEALGVTMAGVKLGQRLLAVGTKDPKLVAALGVKAGLTGRTCVVDADAAQLAKGAEEILKEGALVEPIHAPYGMLPLDAESFDIAVVQHLLPRLDAEARARCVGEVFRVLRPGGRVLVVEPARRSGFGVLLQRQTADPGYKGPADVLQVAGFTAVRVLAETDGVVYAEGIKRA
jgi:ubiquinone/menaquinone biosynthesis C-methylase UbiE